jgi:thiosulfate/3-mercaptopyruvate sulfurtransferase
MTGKEESYPDNRVICWISPEWLEAHLRDAGLVILDCRQDSHDYCTAHIPGSIHLNEALLRMHIGRLPVRWISAEAAQQLFCTLGLGADRLVVVYTACIQADAVPQAARGDGLEAALVAYSLVRFGCRRVMILDGGLSQWKAEGRPLAQEYGETLPSAFTVEVPIDLFIGYEECVRIKDGPDVVLLDTRPSAWYEGQGPWRMPGHIPGAVSLPASRLLVPGNTTRLKSDTEIRAILADLGVMPEKTVICSSSTGRSAATVFLVLKWYLGYPDVVMFEGGFSEWVSHAENRTVTGKKPR